MSELRYYDLAFGITTIDTGFLRPDFDASYLIVEGEKGAFVDVGTSHSVPILLDVLREKHLPPENIKYVIITHIHLDHAGGAGMLLKHLPHAELVVHPKGARYLIAPDRLISGSLTIYGSGRFQTLFGDIVPVLRERVIEAKHESRLSLNGRELLFLDTPGHARHHVSVFDERSQGFFTGDTFGNSYRAFDTDRGNFIFPASAPVDFDPDRMHASIELLMSYHPQSMYLTHFGCVKDVPRLAEDLHEAIEQLVALGHRVHTQSEERHRELTEGLKDIFLSRLKTHGCKLDREQIMMLIQPDLTIDVQGLEVWLDRIQKRNHSCS